MANDHEFETLQQRLGIIIALLLKIVPRQSESLSLRDQVQLLSDLGVRPRDIAEILGRTQAYVNKELATIRKHRGKAK